MPVAIEPDVDVCAANRKHGFVGVGKSAVGHDNRPALAEVDRLGHNHVEALALQPGSVYGAVVRVIDHDLGIVLARPRLGDFAWRLPGGAIVVAHHQNHGWQRATAAFVYEPVLG